MILGRWSAHPDHFGVVAPVAILLFAGGSAVIAPGGSS